MTNYSKTQIGEAARRVKVYIENKKALPTAVAIGADKVPMRNFLYLLTKILVTNKGYVTNVSVSNPVTKSSTFKSGKIDKTHYVDLAKRVSTFIETEKQAPAYANTPLGGMSYQQLIYNFSKILNYVYTKRLTPNYVSVNQFSIKVPVTTTSTYPMGYFINPEQTLIDPIQIASLVKKGVTRYAVRIFEADYKDALTYKATINKAGGTFYAWVWKGFDKVYATYLAKNKVHIVYDVETYDMEKELPAIKELYAVTKQYGVQLILCVKAEGWDGGQLYKELVKYCDRVMPMLYLGDYAKTISDLTAFLKTWTTTYPNKFYAALETYFSDQKTVAKPAETITAEINAAKQFVKSIFLFRFGLSNYLVSTTPVEPSYSSGNWGILEKGVKKIYANITAITNDVRKYCIYSYYFNDKKTFLQELNALISSILGKDNGENCVDYAQCCQKLAKEKGYGGGRFSKYPVILGIYCDADQIWHAVVYMTGNEFAKTSCVINNKTEPGAIVDWAKIADEGGAINTHWCNVNHAVISPSWAPYE